MARDHKVKRNAIQGREESMSEKKLLTISETADRLSLGKSKTYELIQEGRLNAVRIGRAVRIEVGELDRFVERLQTNQDDEPDK